MVVRRFNSNLTATAYLSELERVGMRAELSFNPRGPTDELPFAVLFALLADEDAGRDGHEMSAGESILSPSAE